VTAVTDSGKFTLVMFGYSASLIFEFATGSSSGEIQVDSRPSLNRANFPGRSPKFKKLRSAENRQPNRAPSHKNFLRASSAAAPRPDSIVNYLKTATSAFQVYLLSGSKRILNRLTPAKLLRNRLGTPFRVGDEETGRRREIAAGPFKQTSSARETESNHYEL